MVSRKQWRGRRHSANRVSPSTTGTSGVSSAQRSVAQFVLGSPQRATTNDVPRSAGTQRSAIEFGARAYTSGRHIVAGPSGLDRRTLAHELTHVLQQRQGPVSGAVHGDGLLTSEPSDRFEREAEATATRVMTMPTNSPALAATTRTQGGTAEMLALQHAVGDATVCRQLTHDRSEHGTADVTVVSPAVTSVQRTIVVGGEPVNDPITLLTNAEKQHFLSETGRQVLEWARTDKAKLTAADADGLLAETKRIAAMIDLVGSILDKGILGRRTLSEQGLTYTGSNDRGNTTALAVNVLDARGGTHLIDEMVKHSLTAPNHGSFSVAMERPAGNDMVLDQMATDAAQVELSEEDLQKARDQADGDPDWERIFAKRMLENAKAEVYERTLKLNQAVFDRRVQNTMMAIMAKPNKEIAIRNVPGDYESSVRADQIPPGPSGFTTLVFPEWFETYFPLLCASGRVWPENVTTRFVSTDQITAHYRAQGQNWEITVNAPDYADEISKQLRKLEYIATHILKTDTS
jgi:hypothetical protein